jgi:RHS repeat-associated protein
MTRFADPAGGTSPVLWSWRLDSVGQTLQRQEPEAATRFHTYSDWGEAVETRWTDGAIDRQLVNRYDALGRLTATEERNNGVADAETVNNYAYDVGVNVSPQVTPSFVLGRLACASSPNRQIAFSYDAFGRANARTFTDNQGGLYIEKSEFHADGSPALLEFNLPDQSYDKEQVKYSYDSAGRLRTMRHADTSGARELYSAEIIDPFGRVRKALYGGNTAYHAVYADEGRRLLSEATVESSFGSRRLVFPSYDALGRELSRREIKDGAPSGPETSVSYDELGHVVTSVKTDGAATLSYWKFNYDRLGNIRGLTDSIGAADAALSYGGTDPDRVCRINYGTGGLGGTACNVVHDVLGNVISQPTRSGTRQLSYFASGGIRTITEQGTQARFAYDAFGQVQELDVQGGATQDTRRDRRYGGLIEQRDAVSSGSTTSFVTRQIPGPGGIVASRRGPGNEWVFEFGELRGNRFFTDQNGAFVQDVEYQPFGEATSNGTPAGTSSYTSYQWNAGDALPAFGLSHLGARLYDPVIGRFLSRDPLLIPRTAATTNPYSFAMNDPLNAADPSGLCAGGIDSKRRRACRLAFTFSVRRRLQRCAAGEGRPSDPSGFGALCDGERRARLCALRL